MEILMPALSPTMSEGKLAKWLVKEGDEIKAGDLLAEIETDKAIMEFESSSDGILTKILVPEGGGSIGVNQPIAVLENDLPTTLEESTPSTKNFSDDSMKNNDPPLNNEIEKNKIAPRKSNSINETEIQQKESVSTRIKASPLAKKMAEKLNLNLANIIGSGPAGRIVRDDVAEYKERNTNLQVSSDTIKTDIINTTNELNQAERIELTPMRKTIAERLTSAKRDIPHFYLRKKARVDKLLLARGILNKNLHNKGITVSLNDIILKAVGQALIENPDCNVTWGGDCIFRAKVSDIAMAVAIKGGLLTPVIKNVARKSLSEISCTTKDLIKRSKEKKLTPTEFSGGTITISNLGMMGIESFDAVINPPHGSILAVGTTEIVPIFNENGELEKATIMNLTLSVDHRAIDGSTGASFLESIVSFLEEPINLLTY